MGYSIKEPPLSDIGDALVHLSSYVEGRRRSGFFNDSEFLGLRDKTFQVLYDNFDLPDDVIMPYWRNYFRIILDAIKKDSKLESDLENDRASRTSPLASRRSPIPRKIPDKSENSDLRYAEVMRAGSVMNGRRRGGDIS